MAEQPDEQVRPSIAQETTEAELRLIPPSYAESPNVYSNFAQATVAPHDLTLYFGWYAVPTVEPPPSGSVDVPVRPVMTVTIPVGLIPGLIRVLQAQAAAWEQSTGGSLPPARAVRARADTKEQDE